MKELTVSEQLDGAFAAAQLAWRRGTWRWHVPTVLAALALGGFAWTRITRDLIVSRGFAIHPTTQLVLTAGRYALVSLGVVVGWSAMRHVWRAARDPLPRLASRSRLAVSGLLLLLVWPLVALAPVFLGALKEVVHGAASLMPFSWSENRGGLLVLGALYWLAVLPLFRLAPAIVAIEGLDPLRALGRSFALVRRAEGRVHLINLFWEPFLLLMAFGLSAPLQVVLGGGAPPSSPEAAFWALTGDASPLLGITLVTVHALWAPQVQLSYFLSYVDVRVRAEGLDVEIAGRRAGLLPRGATP